MRASYERGAAAAAGLVRLVCLGCSLLPWAARAARPSTIDFDDSDVESQFSSFAEGVQGARLEIKDVEKFEVVPISNEEMMRMRTKGLRFHDVQHRHFNRDPTGPNSMEEEEEEEEESDRVRDHQHPASDAPVPDGAALAAAFMEKADRAAEAGNFSISASGVWSPFKGQACKQSVIDEWHSLAYAVRNKGNGHAYVKCPENNVSFKVSCIERECKGDKWCFVPNNCNWRTCRKIEGQTLRCAGADLHAYDTVYTTTTTTTTGMPSEEGKASLPPLKLAPTQMTGYVCVQFDLDLTVLTGGMFPGLFGVGILGDVHYIPSTKCWGWTNELYLMFSLGLEVGGTNFRISAVFIATLVVTEQPLDTARDQLAWELPHNMDTSRCHTKDPFTLLEKTFKSQWKYMISHILTRQPTRDQKLREAIHNFDALSNKGFAKFVDLLADKPVNAKVADVIKPEDAAAKGQQTQALVRSYELGRIDVSVDAEPDHLSLRILRHKIHPEVLAQTAWAKVVVWQDWDAVIYEQSSEAVRLELPEGEQQIILRFPVRLNHIAVGAIFLMNSAGFIHHQAGFTAGTSLSYGQTVLPLGVREFEWGRSGTLAVEGIHVYPQGCKRAPETLQLSVLTAAADGWRSATWSAEDFGTASPWGMHANSWHPAKAIPHEASKLVDQTKPIVSLDRLDFKDVLAILDHGLGANTTAEFADTASGDVQDAQPTSADNLSRASVWMPIWNDFATVAQKSVQDVRSATDYVNLDLLRNFIVKLLWGNRDGIGRYIQDLKAKKQEGPIKEVIRFVASLQSRLEDFESIGAGLESQREEGGQFEWRRFAGRTVNADRCKMLAKEALSDNLDTCQDECRALRPDLCRDTPCRQSSEAWRSTGGRKQAVCNAARFDKDDRLCSLWHCSSWDNFPHNDGYDVMAYLPEGDSSVTFTLSPVQVLKHIDLEKLEQAVSSLDEQQVRNILQDVRELPGWEKAWKETVLDVVFPGEAPDMEQFKQGPVRSLVLRMLSHDKRWHRDATMARLVASEWAYDDKKVEVRIRLTDAARRSSQQSLQIGDQMISSASSFETKTKVSMFSCSANVVIHWKWQLHSLQAFFKRPKLVPTSQAMFAAFDQFVSKLPAYSEQVVERLTSKAEKDRSALFKKEKLPYQTTDGRFLHRHLKKSEHENLQVHKGDLGSDDAVMNYPKAMRTSKHRKEPSFWFNTGLSAANLFLRAVSDVQALFFLYFANHPDWDGQCMSLPTKFNLFYERPNGSPWGRSNWDSKDTAGSKAHRRGSKRGDKGEMPQYRTGDTVGEKGNLMDKDDLALIREWHWISKPHWFQSESKRAGFFVKTPPVHGKDGWATENVSELSAVMYPHLWCELVEQFWVQGEEQQAVKKMKMKLKTSATDIDDTLSQEIEGTQLQPVQAHKEVDEAQPEPVQALLEVEQEADALAPQEPNASFSRDMFGALRTSKASIRASFLTCPKQAGSSKSESESEHEIRLGLALLGGRYGESLKSLQTVLTFYQFVVNFVRRDLTAAAATDDEKEAKAAQAELTKLESVSETLDKIRSTSHEQRAQIETMARAVYKGFELSVQDLVGVDPSHAAKHRRDFHETKENVEITHKENSMRFEECQAQIERFLQAYPWQHSKSYKYQSKWRRGAGKPEQANKLSDRLQDILDRAVVNPPDEATMEDSRRAITYSGTVLKSVLTVQQRVLIEFNMMFGCVDLASRPVPLSANRFEPWVVEKHLEHFFGKGTSKTPRFDRTWDIVMETQSEDDSPVMQFDNMELMFSRQCRVPVDFKWESGYAPPDDAWQPPRPECERLLLSKQLLTIFPQFAKHVFDTFRRIEASLEQLRESPTEQHAQKVIEEVREFVESLKESKRSFDPDFLTAFAYNKDGSLYGDLWSSLKDSTAKIIASLQERTDGRRNWIIESIRDRALLKDARRLRVREEKPPEPEIPTEADGCVCEKTWKQWVSNRWHDDNKNSTQTRKKTFGFIPKRVDLHGCQRVLEGPGKANQDGMFVRVDDDTIGEIQTGAVGAERWLGICRTTQKKRSLVECAEKYAPCNPDKLEDTRPTYKIWRRGEAFHQDEVTLPLVQMDLYMSFDVRSSRADFCTPNFAPLLVKHTKHWSALSWVPWEIRKTTCWGARLHPPGISALLLRCNHQEPGEKNERTGQSIEWQVVITAYLISYYNTWGTSDGDMTQSWFDGSWGGSAGAKGMPGVLTGTSTWANTAGGFGYMETGPVMQSPPAFWFAVIAECLAAFAVSSVFTQKDEGGVGMTQIMTAGAAIFWQVLKKYGAVPLVWGLNVGVGQVSKYMQDITGITFSPWRMEHDVILAVQWSYLCRDNFRRAADIVDGLDPHQMQLAITEGESYSGLEMSWAWNEFQQQIGNSPNEIKHLSRDVLAYMLENWMREIQMEKTRVQQMFSSCTRRPKWYRINPSSSMKVYPFWGRSQQKWLDSQKKPGKDLFLIDFGDGWYVEIRDGSEEDRYYPAEYITRDVLEVHYDVLPGKGFDDKQITPTGFSNLLRQANMMDVRCWTTTAYHDMPGLLADAQQHWTVKRGSLSELTAEYFSAEYSRRFLTNTWNSFVEDNKSLKKSMTALWLNRGVNSTVNVQENMGRELSRFKRTNWAISLSLLHRIGLPFMKIPNLFQVQPYAQLAIAFDVKAILKSVWTRLSSKIKGKKKLSMLGAHKARIDKCRACVTAGQAFCDRDEAAKAMLKGGWTESMDECLPKTSRAKQDCYSFVWNVSGAGPLFNRQVCPCFGVRSGTQMNPRWITSEDHCAEMRWPDDDSENDRRQMKATDWELGFTSSIGDQGKQVLNINDDMEFEGTPKGCEEGFRCCGTFVLGKEMLRCVELKGISKMKSGWLTRQKCKNFKPTDVATDRPWSHVKQEFRCSPRKYKAGNTSYAGTWVVHDGKWVDRAELASDEEEADSW